MSVGWQAIWERKHADFDPSSGSPILSQLLAADGFDTGFGNVTLEDWSDFANRTCERLGLSEGDSLFEVGCGAGAFLYLPYQRGVSVGGLDYSPSLIDCARLVMPQGQFAVQEAVAIDTATPADVVVSSAVFLYFESLNYAHKVIERMCSKAVRAVAILDMPDAAMADEALADRQAIYGGPEAYAERYAGLDHVSYDRDWVVDALAAAGMNEIIIESQDILGYRNGKFRFNALAWV